MNINPEHNIVFVSWNVNDIRILAEQEENEAVMNLSDQQIWHALNNAVYEDMPFDPWHIVRTVERLSGM